MNARATLVSLRTVHPFGISRGTISENQVVLLELEGGGIGECSPVRYHKHDAGEGARLALEMARDVTPDNLFDLDHHARRAREIAPHHSSARAAFDIALHDRIGHELGLPLYKLMGFSQPINSRSSFTIGLASDEEMVRKTHEAASFPNLKIKLGRDDAATDLATIRAIRAAAPDKTIRVDANAGWSLDTAIAFAKGCGDVNLEFIEQPLAIGNYEGLAKLKAISPLPIVVDEDVQDLASLPPLVGKVHGINIKLMKCGGLWEARQMIGFARAHGWSVMLGCMIETGVGVSAAAHLAGAAQDVDLDAELLIANNPATPTLMQQDGLLRVPTTPGLGVSLDAARAK
ncbi:MAG: dipeptide epimerase [Candidatus Sumerlaeia bacterium]|nr:dipeptide epimerase [Candidatus Sumerlaeia bacterium]